MKLVQITEDAFGYWGEVPSVNAKGDSLVNAASLTSTTVTRIPAMVTRALTHSTASCAAAPQRSRAIGVKASLTPVRHNRAPMAAAVC